MEVVASTAFGLDIDARKENHEFVRNAEKMFQFTFTSPGFLIALCFPFLIPVFEYFGVTLFSDNPATEFFKKVVSDALKERRSSSDDHRRPDFLNLMVEAEQEFKEKTDGKQIGKGGLTTEEITAQAIIFMIAGYETTASTLTFLLYNLATHPECQHKVVQEIYDVIPAEDEPGYDSVFKLHYLDQCINETLRLYPPAARIVRTAVKDTEVGGIKIQKGLRVQIPVKHLHKNPEYWPDPEKFDPERFTKEAKEQRHPFCFLPFGHGPRHCIGMRLAEMEMKMLMVKVLRKFRFTQTPNTKVPPVLKKHGFLPQMQIPVYLGVEQRKRCA